MITTSIARVGSDAEIRETKNGKKYLLFRAAENGVKEGDTTWISVRLFTENAENLAKYVTKGKLVALTGELSVGAYISKKSGEAIPSIDLNATTMKFISTNQKQETDSEPNPDEMTCGTLKPAAEPEKIPATKTAAPADDDLPF